MIYLLLPIAFIMFVVAAQLQHMWVKSKKNKCNWCQRPFDK